MITDRPLPLAVPQIFLDGGVDASILPDTGSGVDRLSRGFLKHPDTYLNINDLFHVKLDIETWGQFMAASLEEQRRFMRELLAEWEMNRARDLAEDERRDGLRGHWGD